MNRILVIGSAVADVTITLPHLPEKKEDVHVRTQHMSLGGCGMNTYDIIRRFRADAIPFFPVGRGAYGDFVRAQMKLRGISSPIPEPGEENGCCYCFIEDDGERTFLSYHGAEYRFKKEWFSLIDQDTIGYVYVCGLEIEEPTGVHIVSFLEALKERNQDVKIFFAPGPRIARIDPALFMRLASLSPILHLNEDEAGKAVEICLDSSSACPPVSVTDCMTTGELLAHMHVLAQSLYSITASPVMITLGDKGSCYYDQGDFGHIPAFKVKQIDTNGAGDAHIGAVIAAVSVGKNLREALMIANRISSIVVSQPGATISDRDFPYGLL